ncbi:hypothetical protein AA21291_1014 [Swaminathania salitolerans LMG 21291]|uniref:Uncharacterized protein n=1 Tax=Swaminathania salitolerans TaxID=182838 RepID=A0A511BS69_9PROT|nr:hypothetical protein AA21291_1014 [Swaminathania salitolerans LMG 21291]GEL02673.1 hypothetical protein SSA02_18360 [Swaminathania salitolerans]
MRCPRLSVPGCRPKAQFPGAVNGFAFRAPSPAVLSGRRLRSLCLTPLPLAPLSLAPLSLALALPFHESVFFQGFSQPFFPAVVPVTIGHAIPARADIAESLSTPFVLMFPTG